mmetsp:Transcript_22369/g.58348  ORF Transcript_22369/g.58348 Transcript_22369/m.58348 type:complete len:216 (-) Transcript_22369:492-1139(-)
MPLAILADGHPGLNRNTTSVATPQTQPHLPRTGLPSLADMVMVIPNTRHRINSAGAGGCRVSEHPPSRLLSPSCRCCKAVSKAMLPACTPHSWEVVLPSTPNTDMPSTCQGCLLSSCSGIAASTYKPAAACTGIHRKSAQLSRRALGEGTAVDSTWISKHVPACKMPGYGFPPGPSCFQRGQCFSLQIRAQQGAQEGLRGRAAHMCSRGQCKGCA